MNESLAIPAERATATNEPISEQIVDAHLVGPEKYATVHEAVPVAEPLPEMNEQTVRAGS